MYVSDSESDDDKLQVYDQDNEELAAGEPAPKKIKTSNKMDGYTDFAKRMMVQLY